MVLRVMEKTWVVVIAREMMYKAVVQTIMLYGGNSRLIADTMMKVLEGFHTRISRSITGKT